MMLEIDDFENYLIKNQINLKFQLLEQIILNLEMMNEFSAHDALIMCCSKNYY